jgi:PKD repeat protein
MRRNPPTGSAGYYRLLRRRDVLCRRRDLYSFRLPFPAFVLDLVLLSCLGLAGCGGSSSPHSIPAPAPTISSFAVSPASIASGASATLNWTTTGATSIAISPGAFTSTSATGSTSVNPTATTTYTLNASNASGSVTATATITVQAPAPPSISSFTANPTSITTGGSSTLSWTTTGATSIAITPGTFTSTSATGSTTVSPAATTTYTLTASNAAGSATGTATVTVTGAGGALQIVTSSCAGGTQNAAYAGCSITASGGTPPYTFSVDSSGNYAPLPEGMALNAQTGEISSALIGGQGTYVPQIVVQDASGAQATADISFAINGNSAFLASIFPPDSIFHHRVDAASTGLPVDSSPAAAIYSGYLSSTIKPFFGGEAYESFPNGIPATEVPWNQPDVAVSTTVYQSYFTSGPIPPYAPVEGTSNSTGDRHVLVYLEAGNGNKPALYEMWQGIYEGGPWTDSSNALWPDVSSDNLTPQGQGTSDAAGLPVGPLLVNADEVIGTGTPTAPNGVVQHPVRFTLNHMLNYWVWPATETAGVGSCTQSGSSIPVESEISQSSPPDSCTMTGPAGEIYRLRASVATPACASSSPQAAIIITAFRNYGIILADNGDSGGLIGTPDARWNDNDLSCLRSLTLADFEPVNVSSLMVSNDSGATSH